MDFPAASGRSPDLTDGVLKLYDAEWGGRVSSRQCADPRLSHADGVSAEFQGVERKPVRRAWGSPGTSVLILTAADLAPIEQRLKAAGTPLAVSLQSACDGRGLVAQDPDGFAVMVVERKSSAPAPPRPTRPRPPSPR